VKTLVAFTAGTIAALLWTSQAVAASLTNRDDKDHKVTIMESDAKQEHVLKPAASLQGICRKGCVIRLDDSESDEYELDGSEVVSIEDNYLYYDGPDQPAEQGKADATAPPAAGK
jgi:hypothetical protein